jgi:hypothetical protein
MKSETKQKGAKRDFSERCCQANFSKSGEQFFRQGFPEKVKNGGTQTRKSE